MKYIENYFMKTENKKSLGNSLLRIGFKMMRVIRFELPTSSLKVPNNPTKTIFLKQLIFLCKLFPEFSRGTMIDLTTFKNNYQTNSQFV